MKPWKYNSITSERIASGAPDVVRSAMPDIARKDNELALTRASEWTKIRQEDDDDDDYEEEEEDTTSGRGTWPRQILNGTTKNQDGWSTKNLGSLHKKTPGFSHLSPLPAQPDAAHRLLRSVDSPSFHSAQNHLFNDGVVTASAAYEQPSSCPEWQKFGFVVQSETKTARPIETKAHYDDLKNVRTVQRLWTDQAVQLNERMWRNRQRARADGTISSSLDVEDGLRETNKTYGQQQHINESIGQHMSDSLKQTGTGQTHLGLYFDAVENNSPKSTNDYRSSASRRLLGQTAEGRKGQETSEIYRNCHTGSNEFSAPVVVNPVSIIYRHVPMQRRLSGEKDFQQNDCQNAAISGSNFHRNIRSSPLIVAASERNDFRNQTTETIAAERSMNNRSRDEQTRRSRDQRSPNDYDLLDDRLMPQNRLFRHQDIATRSGLNLSFNEDAKTTTEAVESMDDTFQSKNRMIEKLFDSKYNSRRNNYAKQLQMTTTTSTTTTTRDISRIMTNDGKRLLMDQHRSWIQMEENLLCRIHDLQRERNALRVQIEDLTAQNQELTGKLETVADQLEAKDKSMANERRQLRERILDLMESGRRAEQKRGTGNEEEAVSAERLNTDELTKNARQSVDHHDDDSLRRDRQVAQEELAACQIRFAVEREKWTNEKVKVIRYQRLLQKEYEEVLAENQLLKLKLDCGQ